MYTVGRLAAKYGLSRTTLLYYDSIGLLKPLHRQPGEYRRYSDEQDGRLSQIMVYRRAGLSLDAIRDVLDSPNSSLAHVLEDRLEELNSDINRLREQQRVILGLLKSGTAVEKIGVMNRQTWSELLVAAGFSDQDMRQWHIDFEQTSPQRHLGFLRFLCIPEEDIQVIRSWKAG